MTQNEWRPVLGLEEFYDVSANGQVRTKHKLGRAHLKKILSQTSNKKGYLRVRLTAEKGTFTKVVHRLVLEAFVGPQPSPIHETNHKNGIKSDNRIENLEWVTRKENNAHAVRIGLWHPLIGEAHGMAILNEHSVREIKELLRLGASCNGLGRMYGVSHMAIRHIKNGVNWKHVE